MSIEGLALEWAKDYIREHCPKLRVDQLGTKELKITIDKIYPGGWEKFYQHTFEQVVA